MELQAFSGLSVEVLKTWTHKLDDQLWLCVAESNLRLPCTGMLRQYQPHIQVWLRLRDISKFTFKVYRT